MLNPIRLVSSEEEGNLDTDPQGRTPHEDRGLDWNWHLQAIPSFWQSPKTRRHTMKQVLPAQSLQRNQPYKHLNFRFLIVGKSIFFFILASHFVAFVKAAVGDTLGSLYTFNYSQNI